MQSHLTIYEVEAVIILLSIILLTLVSTLDAVAVEFSWNEGEKLTSPALPTSLKGSIEQYYLAENNRFWFDAYKFRTGQFQDMIPYPIYVDQMQTDTSGWVIERLYINNIEIDYRNNRKIFRVEIEFLDRISDISEIRRELPDEFIELAATNGVSLTEQTIWVLEDDVWRCMYCGIRNHVFLNMIFDQ